MVVAPKSTWEFFCRLGIGIFLLLIIYVTALPVCKRERGSGHLGWCSWKQVHFLWNHNDSSCYRKIIAITDHASNILQSEKIDLLIAVKLVETVERQLRHLRSDSTKVLAETKEFCSRQNLVRQNFPAKRVRRSKKASDKLSSQWWNWRESNRQIQTRDIHIF